MAATPVYPTPAGGNTTAPIGTESWFVVWYTKPQNSVSSRLTGPAGSGTQASVVVQAASASQAQAAEQAKLGVQATVTEVDGPYGSASGAQHGQSAKQAQINQATQAGNIPIPNPLSGLDAIGAFFSALSEANTWIRVSKVVIGGLLLIIGLVHITGAGGAAASVARKVPLPI